MFYRKSGRREKNDPWPILCTQNWVHRSLVKLKKGLHDMFRSKSFKGVYQICQQ